MLVFPYETLFIEQRVYIINTINLIIFRNRRFRNVFLILERMKY